MTPRQRQAQKGRLLTLQVLGSEEYATNMMFLDQRTDVRSDRGAIEAHHEQLALQSLCQRILSQHGRKRPTIVLHHGQVSLVFGHIAHPEDGSGRDAYLSRSSQTGSMFSTLLMVTAPSRRNEVLDTTWVSGWAPRRGRN
jgi:hypothetical protein